MNNLTVFEFNSEHSHNSSNLHVSIIQHLPALKSLEFNKMSVHNQGIVDSNEDLATISTGLESVRISQFLVEPGGDAFLYDINLLFKFVPKSRLNLKKLELDTCDIFDDGGITLDCTRNQSLQQIKLDMPRCQYYKFHHESGNYWRNTNEEIIIDKDNFKMRGYFVELAWDTSRNIEVQLSGCTS